MPPLYGHEHEDEVVPFAQTNFRGRTQRFGIKTDDRRRHMYLVGKTGMGKTSMLEQLVYHDIVAGHGVAYIDPHGDTANKLLNHIPSSRINDVIYFNPGDLDWPVAFNVLEQIGDSHKHLVASGLIGIFKKIWADSWGPRLEYVLRNAILALMDYPGTTLLGIMRILVDKDYRRKVVAAVQDPVVKSFWVDEYARYPDKFQTEAIAPIQNKVGQFLSSPLIRNIVGQVKSTIRIPEIMDNRKILIMNLAKGGVGEDNSALLGAMMVTKIYLAAMERVRIAEADRQDFYLYVDEFQNFATDSFADILSESRKYRLNLTLAHQYIGQLMTDTSTKVRDAVYGNVGTLITFRIGAQDAEFLEPEFLPTLEQEDLVNLPKWSVYLKLMINGITSDPFSAGTLPPIEVQHEDTGNREKVIQQSHERYTVPREEIELKIAKWTGMVPSEEGEAEDTGEREEEEWSAARAKARDYTRDLPKDGRGAFQRPVGKPPAADRRQEAPRGTGAGRARSAAGGAGGGRRSGAPSSTVNRSGAERPPARRTPPAPAVDDNAGGGGGWYRNALRESGGAGGGMATAQNKPAQRIVECASCGGGATVFFNPRPGQRILCENCIRGEKEKKKMAEIEAAARVKREERKKTEVSSDDQQTTLAPSAQQPSSSPLQTDTSSSVGRGDARGAGRVRPREDRGPRSDARSQKLSPPRMDEGAPVERTAGGSGSDLSLGDLLGEKSDDDDAGAGEEQA